MSYTIINSTIIIIIIIIIVVVVIIITITIATAIVITIIIYIEAVAFSPISTRDCDCVDVYAYVDVNVNRYHADYVVLGSRAYTPNCKHELRKTFIYLANLDYLIQNYDHLNYGFRGRCNNDLLLKYHIQPVPENNILFSIQAII